IINWFRRSITTRIAVLSILFSYACLSAQAQYFDIQGSRKRVNIPFRMVRDMIVLKLNINNKGPFNFILDSGVGLMLITDPKLVDSINISNKRTIKISGLGEGEDYEAYVTSPLNVDIPGLTSYDVSAAILKKDHFGLSNYAGMPIHGLLGYEFFTNFAVKIDFADSTLSVSRPKEIRSFRKGSKIPLTIENRKPYIHCIVTFPNGKKTNNKLVLDLGAGHPLSLENVIKKHGLPEKFIAANLGVGLTGPISGFISRIKELELGRYKIKGVITSFPEEKPDIDLSEHRDGNLGIQVLKRFSLIIDYPDSCIYLKPGPELNAPFEHDMSGLEYYCTGDNYNRVLISRVEPGSAADEIGLEKDDEIIAINFKPVSSMTLEQIDALFRSHDDRSLLLEVYHDKKLDQVIITLKRRV
ncbi:MAG: aspartyl protease family protein, partial [Bacteroidota bacterium]|nr:aspartyl protease family protein [Bacteroidota bacterium]